MKSFLAAGKWRAVSRVVVSLHHHGQQKDWVEYKPGEEFEIPKGVNGFSHFAVWEPDLGSPEPQLEKIA